MWTFIGLVVFAGIGVFAYRLTKLIDECNDASDEAMRIINEFERLKPGNREINDEQRKSNN